MLLIGDAGGPALDEPVLAALREAAGERPARSLIVFLGDNLYPHGMPPADDPSRAESERRLRAQVEAARDSGAPTIFLPGNHDWDQGAASLREQEALIDAWGGDGVELAPRGGCPGPLTRRPTAGLRLLLLDTSWWFRTADRPVGCASTDDATWLEAIATALAEPHEGVTFILGHHPLASGGRHGGHFAWHEHLFPLRHVHASLWIPLPLIGSLYPVARMLGIADQDLTSSRYGALRSGLETVLRPHRPLLFAAGHEHNLQVLSGKATDFMLVSGAGIYGDTTGVVSEDDALFTSDDAGFMRVDLLEDGRIRLGVLTAKADGSSNEVFATWLQATPSSVD